MNTSKAAVYLQTTLKWLIGLLMLGLAALFAMTIGRPVVDGFVSLLALNTQEGLWYLIRAAGLVAYLLLWLSSIWGLAVASKIFDPILHRAFTFDAHEFLSLLAIGFTVLHVGALLMDTYMQFSIADVLVPFIAPYRPIWVGIGVIATYLTVLVTATYYMRKRIGHEAFRTIHLLSLMAYAGVTVHSMLSGTDTALWSAKIIYAGSGAVFLFMTVYWYLSTRLSQPVQRRVVHAP